MRNENKRESVKSLVQGLNAWTKIGRIVRGVQSAKDGI